jgi:transposase
VVDLDGPLGQELFHVTVRESKAQAPPHRQDDHLRRKPEPSERRGRDRWDNTANGAHQPSMTTAAPNHGCNSAPEVVKQLAKTHPHQELHLVCDNYATHKHPNVRAWLERNPRITLHFTPTSGSWLNMVEIFFDIITRQAIRCGSFTSVKRPHRHDPPLHRQLQRPLPTLHLDQRRRHHPRKAQRSPKTKEGDLTRH